MWLPLTERQCEQTPRIQNKQRLLRNGAQSGDKARPPETSGPYRPYRVLDGQMRRGWDPFEDGDTSHQTDPQRTSRRAFSPTVLCWWVTLVPC